MSLGAQIIIRQIAQHPDTCRLRRRFSTNQQRSATDHDAVSFQAPRIARRSRANAVDHHNHDHAVTGLPLKLTFHRGSGSLKIDFRSSLRTPSRGRGRYRSTARDACCTATVSGLFGFRRLLRHRGPAPPTPRAYTISGRNRSVCPISAQRSASLTA